MQIGPVPPPVAGTSTPTQTPMQALPQAQAQAVAPITQRAVEGTTKSEKRQNAKSNGDKAKRGDNDGAASEGGQRGKVINTSA